MVLVLVLTFSNLEKKNLLVQAGNSEEGNTTSGRVTELLE